MDSNVKFNKSASRTILLLEHLALSDKPQNLAEIANALIIPKSSCFEIIKTLQTLDAIEVADEELKTYRVGVKIFQIGSSVVKNTSLNAIVHEVLASLSLELNQTMYFAIRKHNKIIYMDKVEALQPVRSTCVIGSTNYLHLTGLGKAILATYDNETVKKLVGPGVLVAKTAYSITSIDDLLVDLDLTRERGYSVDDREGMDYVKCISAPILDQEGSCIGAISIASLDELLPSDKYEEIGCKIKKSALFISNRLGYKRNKLFL